MRWNIFLVPITHQKDVPPRRTKIVYSSDMQQVLFMFLKIIVEVVREASHHPLIIDSEYSLSKIRFHQQEFGNMLYYDK